MKRLLLMLIPAVLFAQVVVDTVIRLPLGVGKGAFLPDLNKLYLSTPPGNGYLVLDCSTYQVKALIPVPRSGLYHFSYNWRRQKLYITDNPRPESTLVIDAVGDSMLTWLVVDPEWHTDAYLSDLDVRFKPALDTLYEYDCASDTIIRRMPVHSTCASWDSVGHKLYVGQGRQKKLYVYDYLADSCVKVIDVSAIDAEMPDACVFSRTHRRAYVSCFQGTLVGMNLGIVDTERDTLVRVLPVDLGGPVYRYVAVDENDGKAYITTYPDTILVVDCKTDSILKKFKCAPNGTIDQCIRWVPWSNRIYLINIYPDGTHGSSLVVIDCNTDSVIVPGMLVSDDFLYDIQLDPIRQRIFVTGGDTNTVYVLRDVEGGVVEDPSSVGPAVVPGLRVQMTSGGYDIQYSLASSCRVDLSVYDLMGREVKRLVAEQQPGGEHRVNWDCRDKDGTTAPRGVYFCRLTAGSVSSVKPSVVTKVVVTR